MVCEWQTRTVNQVPEPILCYFTITYFSRACPYDKQLQILSLDLVSHVIKGPDREAAAWQGHIRN